MRTGDSRDSSINSIRGWLRHLVNLVPGMSAWQTGVLWGILIGVLMGFVSTSVLWLWIIERNYERRHW